MCVCGLSILVGWSQMANNSASRSRPRQRPNNRRKTHHDEVNALEEKMEEGEYDDASAKLVNDNMVG